MWPPEPLSVSQTQRLNLGTSCDQPGAVRLPEPQMRVRARSIIRLSAATPGDMRPSAAPSDVGDSASRPELPPGLRGWLLVYIVGLAVQALHGLFLTVGAVVIFTDPARAGLRSFVPLGALLFYVITNIGLAIYTALVLLLMIRRRRAAIAEQHHPQLPWRSISHVVAPVRREVAGGHHCRLPPRVGGHCLHPEF